MSKRYLALLIVGAAALPQTALSADLDTHLARANASHRFAPPQGDLPEASVSQLSPVDALFNPTLLTVMPVAFGGAPSPNKTSLSSELGTEMQVFPQLRP